MSTPCAKVQVESCDELHLLLNERVLTGTVEVFHSPAIFIAITQPVGTIQVPCRRIATRSHYYVCARAFDPMALCGLLVCVDSCERHLTLRMLSL